VRLITYNVNSISTRLLRLVALLEELRPDVVCVQETKTSPEGFPHGPIEAAGYHVADLSGGRREGVAILSRAEPADVRRGLPGEPDPDEARWVEATVGQVRVVSTYVPNGREVGSETFASKLVFLDAMAERAAQLAGEPTVITGDMNVCPSDLDVWDVAQVHGATHVTEDERSRIRRMFDGGYVDAFRHLVPDEPGFTWWDYRAGHFHKGFGLRIDLALVSEPLARSLAAARVDRDYRKPSKVPGTKPSDHAPLIIDFDGPLHSPSTRG
jgi:exodeoxyribonuclease-3